MAITKVSRGLLSTGISDGSDATAITINSSEQVGIGSTSPSAKLEVLGSSNSTYLKVGGDDNNNARALTFTSSDGSSVAGAVHTIDAPSIQGEMRISTNSSVRVGITSAGNVGVATSTPANLLQIKSTADGSGLTIQRSSTTAGTYGQLSFINTTTNNYSPTAWIRSYRNAAGVNTGEMTFGTAGTERMRVMGTNGNFIVGKTVASSVTTAGFEITGSGKHVYSSNSSATSSTYHAHDGSNFKFYVGYNGTIYATNTSIYNLSDERMKENIRDLDKGLSDILKLKPRRFDWKEGEGSYEKNVSGFIAQEAEEAGFDEFVGDFKHKTLDDAKSFGQGGLIPALVKAIQEQQEIIDNLKARIEVLEA